MIITNCDSTIGDTFWTGVSEVTHSFGNNAQGWKMFGKIFT